MMFSQIVNIPQLGLSRLFAVLLTLLLLPVTAQAAELRLVMVEQAGCIYCARWNAEVSEIYPKTPEGRAAPLQRVDLHAQPPEGVTFVRPAPFTPTFILVRNGAEVSRIEGYPGEDFFWGLLGVMIRKTGVAIEDP